MEKEIEDVDVDCNDLQYISPERNSSKTYLLFLLDPNYPGILLLHVDYPTSEKAPNEKVASQSLVGHSP